MSTIDEPEWVKAQREEARRFANIPKGIWAALFTQSLVMIGLSQFEYQHAIRIGAAFSLLISAGSFYSWRKTRKGSFLNSLAFSLGVVSALFAAGNIIATGVGQGG